MNTELLQRVKECVLEEPKRIDMGKWIRTGDQSSPCGTVGCIAGWTVILAGKPTRQSRMMGTFENAQRLLAITGNQARRLFCMWDWPYFLVGEIRGLEAQTESYAKVVAKRIDHFIQTKGAE